MRASVDLSRCQGHGQCAVALPAVFELTAAERSRVLVEEIPPALEEAVREASLICPEEAITVIEPSGPEPG